MGKRNRKTRWRTLTIADEHSDSEESNTNSGPHHHHLKSYQHKSYYSRFTYSSQSTPTRRYQYDGTKSTRSSSTASENKITFNEDEYTRITTPRQDVLFKKGYLNKPKTYQTQTSTGTSTTSTGNSTGNGTPDHQSTDLEYESQFVFPNGFVDQNGIYYVNSYEGYPLMVYNPPPYYNEFSNAKAKRYSTGSLAESASPNNEETSQEPSQSETPNNTPELNHSYNVVYPGFYFNGNGACQAQDAVDPSTEPRRSKKKKRKRSPPPNKSVQDATTSEYTEESSEEVFVEHPPLSPNPTPEPVAQNEQTSGDKTEERKVDAQKLLLGSLVSTQQKQKTEEDTSASSDVQEGKEEGDETKEEDGQKSFELKPDAEEFIPRAYRRPESIPFDPGVQFIKVAPNFVPVSILSPMTSEFNHPAFIPPGIPINFVPHNFINFVPNYACDEEDSTKAVENNEEIDDKEEKKEPVEETESREGVEIPKEKKSIDIARIVSKLEEAAKEQNDSYSGNPANRPNDRNGTQTSPVHISKDNSTKINGVGRNYRKLRHHNLRNEDSKIDQNQRKTYKFDMERRKRPNWKQPPSPKKELYHPRNIQNGTPQSPGSGARNYSATLKKSQVTSPLILMCERHDERKTERTEQLQAHQLSKVNEAIAESKKEVTKSQNQWISVSSKKKRKNRNIEETEDVQEIAEHKDDDLFETYDVELLEDVVVTTLPLISTEIEQEIAKPLDHSVEDIELVTTEQPNEVIVKLDEEQTTKFLDAIIKEETNTKVKNVKKKSKKSQKVATKRVIITDLDLSVTLPEVTPVLETSAVADLVSSKTEPEPEEEAKCVVVETAIIPEPERSSDLEPEFKVEETKPTKKKKKRVSKPALANSQSSSSTTLNVIDDSYDFLLETSILDDSSDKTNVEISQELDKLIQRGMYSSLEEKIKSLNISESTDGFFKTIISNISSRESSVEKNNYIRNPDFSSLLKNTALSRPKFPIVEVPRQPSIMGDFLGVTSPPQGETHLKENQAEYPSQSKDLYPLTQAVKEWVTKTRETTPEVEIFKSPSTIFREFPRSDEDQIDEVEEDDEADEEQEEMKQKNAVGNSLHAESLNGEKGVAFISDDELTVYSREQSVDLLQYWEDENVPKTLISAQKTGEITTPKVGDTLNTSKKDDGVEVYESKYGKNEDYLKIKAEVEDRKKNDSATYPKHGNLPYRAVCCSIM